MQIDSKAVIQVLVILGALMLGVVMAVSVTTNATGGLAALVPLITGILGILALVAPRTGLFGLAALVIWVDEFKRLAVYFGGASSMTVIQTLAMPFVVLAALNAGFLLNIMFGKVKLDRIAIMIYASAATIGMLIFVTMDAGIAERGQRAANVSGYMTLIPIAYTYLRTFDDWRKFFSFQVIVALPAVAWAIKQYYFGFDGIEWAYARSGLSKVHYVQMFFVSENPRVFGFFGSASALGCAAIYTAYAWWHGFRYQRRRILWFAVAVIFTWALVASTQRTALVYPLIVLVTALAFRQRITTFALYATAGVVFILGVIFSDYLINKGLDDINNSIASNSKWGSEVLRVSTFSDRIRGWQRLKRPESYSLLGTGKETFSDSTLGFDINSGDYSHDIINRILINFGIVGILAVAIPGFIIIWVLHSAVYSQRNPERRRDAAFVLALSLPILGLSMIGGDNFNTNPINLQIWTAVAGVFVVRNQMLAARKANAAGPQEKAAGTHPLLPEAGHPG